MVPAEPPADRAVAANFERFDGFERLDHPGGEANAGSRTDGETPLAQQTFTPAGQDGLVNTLGGQPLPVGSWQPGAHVSRDFLSAAPPVRLLGDGQANQGFAQSVRLGEISDNPPQAGDITSIIAGWG